MNADSLWDATRWREVEHKSSPYHHPLASEPATRRQSMSYTATAVDHHHWPGVARLADSRARPLPPHSEPYAEVSPYPPPSHGRHTPSPGGDHGPPQMVNNASPNNSAFTGSWQGSHRQPDLHRDRPSHRNDAPLSLHIPSTKDLPRISPAYGPLPTEIQSRGSAQSSAAQSTSLPSFAALQERTTRHDDSHDVSDSTPVPPRQPCFCATLRPLLEQTAIAVAELDSSRPIAMPFDLHTETPIRTLEWILEQLTKAKGSVQGSLPTYASFLQQPNQGVSPPTSTKRASESHDAPYLPPLKRPRSDGSADLGNRHFSSSSTRDEYRPSLEAHNMDLPSKSVTTPPAADSYPPSAFPRTSSPSYSARAGRPLPSPSALGYPYPSIPSLHAQAPSAISPTTSYHPPSSVHTTSTSSATSQHIADLQHQVTLKSLALQTLQQEYSTLLQKLQRERVKSQTIEKKTTVADQEVNELTNRNEDLMEQVKLLESQVEDSEKKREAERLDAQREKEQWGRMLEMGGKLHARNIEDRQKMIEEKAQLLKQIATLENGRSTLPQQMPDSSDPVESQTLASSVLGKGTLSNNATATGGDDGGSEVIELRQQLDLMKRRIEGLKFVLEEVRRYNQSLETKARDFMEEGNRLGDAIDKALREQETVNKAKLDEAFRKSNMWTGAVPFGSAPLSKPDEHAYKNAYMDQMLAPKSAPSRSKRQASGSPRVPTTAEMTAAARASSPGPSELGIHVEPSTSSPEELVRALGPVPAPVLPSLSSSASPSSASGRSPDSHVALNQVTNSWPFASG